MYANALFPEVKSESRLIRATVGAVREDGTVCVAGGDHRAFLCDVLVPATGEPLDLVEGDQVLVWDAGEAGARGVVLGRVGSRPPADSRADRVPAGAAGDDPDELVIEARKSLTLRVGDGSITLREDGRIVIKGTDLVSHAKRQNRIRGGSVAIN